MKTNKIKLSISLFILIVFASCTKNLDVKPTSVITTSSFWKTEDDARGILHGMYMQLRDNYTGIFMVGEQRSEIYQRGPIGPSDLILFENAMTPDMPGHPDWFGLYSVVNSANLILKYVPDIPFKVQSNQDRILAEAYTMRAYAYFVMTKTWGDLILRTEPVETSSAEVTVMERSPQAQVFKLIKDDLDKALVLYANNSFPANRSMWSKASANTLKADVYLWTGKRLGGGLADFTTALNACIEAEQADLELLPNFADIFKYDNKGNKEILISSRFHHLDSEAANYFAVMWFHASTVPGSVDDYTRSLIFPTAGGQDRMVITDLVRNQFTNDDTRKEGSFHEMYTYDDPDNPVFYSTLCLKGTGTVVGGNRYFVSDAIIYRYADLLLMKAEAKNALGQDPEAEINKVRQRAYGANFGSHTFVSGTKEENDVAILKERLLELLYEGKRWWDLVRFNKAFEIVPNLQSRAGQDHLLLFPIATSVLSLEPKVKQNPGY